MVLYFFYKNTVMTIPHVLFAFFCGFSGQTIYDDWYISNYNMIFTAAPLVIKACLEQDINHVRDGSGYRPCIPYLYHVGRNSTIFNNKKFIFWEFLGLLHSLICFFIPLLAF